jgi:hypothetical protein
MFKAASVAALACMWFGLAANTLTVDDEQAFLRSFINHYEATPEGRYTHEYHPFLLKWTSQSLDQLGQYLTEHDLNLKGRMLIMGYEENAVPSYYTNFSRSRINDEATRKGNAGWSMKLHNRFGFMTGFLFKDFPLIDEPYSRGYGPCLHLDAETVHIFDPKSAVFQEHAFGDALDVMYKAKEYIMKYAGNNDTPRLLKAIKVFWETLYKEPFMVGSKQIAGTQDVLFSIEYANHLLRSNLPIFNFLVGPDITYPIEITTKQDKWATLHAQHFVKVFAKKLKPLNDEATVYVFCSFVDGVGKSTMLGNIKNWMKYGDNVDAFEHVDNSSSQLAEVFEFAPNVFIADLPAQVSHFTYKPDGIVFADIKTQFSPERCAELENVVKANTARFKNDFNQRVVDVCQIIDRDGYHAPELNDPAQPANAFIKNLILLGSIPHNRWISFIHDGQTYLYKDTKPLEIRSLIPLAKVKSEGLKNIESEQMLFFEGIRLPLKFTAFMDNLTTQLQANGVKNVIFVDFLSMYPRSSRENIRINYLLQQMSLLNPDFDPCMNWYKDFVSGGQMLYLLTHKATSIAMRKSLVAEAEMRLALFKAIIEGEHNDLTGVKINDLSQVLEPLRKKITNDYKTTMYDYVNGKVDRETKQLEKLYGNSKSFVNVQCSSLQRIHAFSQQLEAVFSQLVNNEIIESLWSDLYPAALLKDRIASIIDGERVNKVMQNTEQEAVKLLYVLHPECKNETLLGPCFKSLRACWYASIRNLLYADSFSDGIQLASEPIKLIPIVVKQDGHGLLHVVQHPYKAWDEGDEKALGRAAFYQFHLTQFGKAAFSSIEGIAYRSLWDCKNSAQGLMGFDCMLDQEDKSDRYQYLPPLSSMVYKHHKKYDAATVMYAADLVEVLEQNDEWLYECERHKTLARKNKSFTTFIEAERSRYAGAGAPASYSIARKPCIGGSTQRQLASFVVRLLATLEMVIKDPDADIVVRYGNRDDFKAALKLFERVILPKYCNLVFNQPLFDNSDTTEPYPSWDYWDSIEK